MADDSSNSRFQIERRKGITFNLEIQKKAKGYPVYLRITENGNHRRFKSSVVLKRKSDWDGKHQKIKPTEPLYESWQKELDDLKEKAVNIDRALKKDGVSSSDKIIEQLRAGSRSSSFLVYVEQMESDCRVAGRLSSMNKYGQVARKFRAYMESRGRDPYSVQFKEIDYPFIAGFDAFLQTLDNKQYMKHGKKPDSVTAGARKLHPNYIAKLLQYMNTVFKSAEKTKLIKHEDNPFNDYHIKKVETDREELSQEEVLRIIHLDLKDGSREWHSRNFFLFAMYCAGIRIGDVLCLRWSNITDGRLHYQMSKNHKIQDLPLLPQAQEILDLYRKPDSQPDDFIFPYMKSGEHADKWQNVKSVKDFDGLSGEMKLLYKKTVSAKEALVNQGLKIIREKAGISKPLSSHIARHTFARLAKEVHTDNSLLQGLMMHSSISTTEKYMGRFSSDAKDEALKGVFTQLEPEKRRKDELLKRISTLSEDELEVLWADHLAKNHSK